MPSIDIMRHRHATGSFDGDPEAFHDKVQRSVAEGTVKSATSRGIAAITRMLKGDS